MMVRWRFLLVPLSLFPLAFCQAQTDPLNISLPFTVSIMAPFGCVGLTNCSDEGAKLLPASVTKARETIMVRFKAYFEKGLKLKYLDDSGQKGPQVAADAGIDESTIGVIGLSQHCYLENTILSVNDKITVPDNCLMDQTDYTGFPRSFVTMTSPTGAIGKSISYFLSLYKWMDVAVVSTSNLNDKFHSKARSQMFEQLSSLKVNIRVDSRISPNATNADYKAQAKADLQRARIFIVYDVSPAATLFRTYYQAMIDSGVLGSGEYFVIAYLAFDSNRQWIDNLNIDPSNQVALGASTLRVSNTSLFDLRNIYRNLLILSDAPVPSYANDNWGIFQAQVKSKSIELMKNAAECYPLCSKANISGELDHWDRVQRSYDGLILLATASTDALNVGVNIYKGADLYEYLLSRTIDSITGFKEYIDGYGNLIGSTQVYYFGQGYAKNMGYGLWATGRLTQSSMLTNDWVMEDFRAPLSIDFISGPPPSVPKCGFLGEKCAAPLDSVFIIIICSVLAVIAALSLVFLYLLRKYKLERKLHSLAFLIDRKRITLKRHVNMLSKSARDMASVYGGSVYASQAAINASNFVLQDYEQPNRENAENESLKSILAAGPIKPGEDFETSKWNALGDFAVGLFEGNQVALKRIYMDDVELKRNIRLEIVTLQDCTHENLLGFLGLMVQSPDVFLVNEMAPRGSIKEILDNDELPLDELFINQMARDIIAGLEFLHHSPIGCHGRLKSSNCLIDNRWMVRLSSFGLREMRGEEMPVLDGVQECKDDLWTAPELLRWSTGLAVCSTVLVQKADIYSLAILLYEIFGRAGPWGDEPMEPREIVHKVKNNHGTKKPFRPNLHVLKDSPHDVQVTVAASWAEEAEDRPNIGQIRKKLRVLTVGLKKTIMDNMVAMVEKYTTKLEKDIAERNHELAKEKKKSEELLKMMLPAVVADSLKAGNSVTAQSFSSVTVYFSDCVGFVEMSANSKPIEIVQFLNDLYTCFDSVINKYDVYKVETIADAYMVVSGLPEPNGPHHAGEIASMGLALLHAIKTFSIRHRPGEKVNLRIGMHTGPCVAGVVGLKMPRYCLFGDTVNTASRMESNGIPLRINCSAAAHEELVKLGGYNTEERGLVEMKGKGLQMTYFITGEDLEKRRERITREKVKYRTLRHTVGGEERYINLE